MDVVHVELTPFPLYDQPRFVGRYNRTGAMEFCNVEGASLGPIRGASDLYIVVI
jgi:hypothetical protein